jgi:pantoate--beta-alanine ligase
MSSRNELLTVEERKNAAVISESLFQAYKLKEQKSVNELQNWIADNINKNPYLNVEYVEIVDDRRLQHVKSWDEKGGKVCCVAVFCGKVRLIDNIVFN